MRPPVGANNYYKKMAFTVYVHLLTRLSPQLVEFLSKPQKGWPIFIGPAVVNPEADEGSSAGKGERLAAANAALETATSELSRARQEFQQAQSRLDEISNQPEQPTNTSDIQAELAPKYFEATI